MYWVCIYVLMLYFGFGRFVDIDVFEWLVDEVWYVCEVVCIGGEWVV